MLPIASFCTPTSTPSAKNAGLGSLLGGGSLADWVVLNVQLMDVLHCTYKSSYILQTVVSKLCHETVRGGVAIRYRDNDGDDNCDFSRGGFEKNGSYPQGRAGLMQETRAMINKEAVPGPPTGMRPQSAERRRKKKKKKNGITNSKKRGDGAGLQEMVCLKQSDHERLIRTLSRAIVYGILYGLVPVMVDPDHPNSIRVPPIESGQFVARMMPRGRIDVGWQWRDSDLGTSSVGPASDVWVFVWEDREPLVGSSAPFRSVLLPLLPELMRERELVESDTQAHYELSYPPFMLQENPRQNRDGRANEVLHQFVGDFVGDPMGQRPGHNPGGALSGQQRRMLRLDSGGALRAQHNRMRGLAADMSGQSARVQIDPNTGEVMVVERTTAWQRGIYLAPAGWAPTATGPRPALRNDLLAQRDHVLQIVTSTLGVPVSIAFEGMVLSRQTSNGRPASARTGRQPATGSPGGYENDACSAMRDTVTTVRRELSDFYAQAHVRLIWFREAVGISKEVVMGEELIERDPDGTAAMARQIELMGTTLREAWKSQRYKRLLETEALHRATAVVDQASKLWRGEVLKQQMTAWMGVVAGVEDGTLGFPGDMSLNAQHERERRGDGLEPVDEGLLRDPEDDGDVTAPPRHQREFLEQQDTADVRTSYRGSVSNLDNDRARPQGYRTNPNELSEWDPDRRDRIEDEGWGVSGHTLLPPTDASGQSGYQRRALTEELPSFDKALARAKEMVDARIEQVDRLRRLRARMAPVSGERGDTKVELIWLSPPVPSWGQLREMVMDGMMNPRIFQRMALANLGFNPQTMPEILQQTDPFGFQSPRVQQGVAGTILTNQSREKIERTKADQAKAKATREKKGTTDKRKRVEKEKTPQQQQQTSEGPPKKRNKKNVVI